MTEPHEIHLRNSAQGKISVEFDRLETYLSWPVWTATDARLILAGIDIEDVPDAGPYRFLPGALQHLWGPTCPVTDWTLVELRLRGELEIYSTFVYGAPKKPLGWLKASLELDCEPAWARLLAADGREEFRAAICLVDEYPETGTPQLMQQQASHPVANHLARQGADIKYRRSRPGLAFYEVVKEWDMREPENHLSFCIEMERRYDEPKGEH